MEQGRTRWLAAVIPRRNGKGVTQMSTTTVGTQIYHRDWETGRSLVSSHGWSLPSDAWGGQSRFFGQHGYRVVAHDRRGYKHATPASLHNNMNAHADDLAAIIGTLELRDPLCEQIESKEEQPSAFLKDRHVIWMRWFENEIEARYEAIHTRSARLIFPLFHRSG